METFEGGCLCGRTRYRATGVPRDPSFCHCASCRRAFGAPMVPWATFDRDAFAVTAGALAEYVSSPDVVRSFCPRCGTSLTYRHAARAGDVDVALATLDDPDRVAPAFHTWVRDRLSWVVIGDALPRHDTVLGQ